MRYSRGPRPACPPYPVDIVFDSCWEVIIYHDPVATKDGNVGTTISIIDHDAELITAREPNAYIS